MKIAAVTMVYNEALILPYFLRHYEYLDEIHVLYEIDSTDNTIQLLNNASNVIIEYSHIKDGNDAIDKTDLINQAFYGIKADWVYAVDPDEFIFPQNETPHDFLKRQNYDVVRAAMFQVYRHRTDKDINPSLPTIGQRIHGDPDVFSTAERPNKPANVLYIKPIVVRPSREIRFNPGKHSLEGNMNISPEFYMGAHWNMADQSIAIVRRMQIKARQSERQKVLGMGWQHTDVTEEWIREECERHLDDPIIEELIPVDDKISAEITSICNKSFIQEALIVELKNQIKDRDNQIKDRDNQIKDRDNSLIQITSSITWQIASKFHRIIDTVFPPKTTRGLFLAKLVKRSKRYLLKDQKERK
ncbi:glycosyltransferase family 2 protein [Chloroflexota bacterium]